MKAGHDGPPQQLGGFRPGQTFATPAEQKESAPSEKETVLQAFLQEVARRTDSVHTFVRELNHRQLMQLHRLEGAAKAEVGHSDAEIVMKAWPSAPSAGEVMEIVLRCLGDVEQELDQLMQRQLLAAAFA